jgi:hypothetical protein
MIELLGKKRHLGGMIEYSDDENDYSVVDYFMNFDFNDTELVPKEHEAQIELLGKKRHPGGMIEYSDGEQ